MGIGKGCGHVGIDLEVYTSIWCSLVQASASPQMTQMLVDRVFR